MNETIPKKMVSRNVAIALGIICIILIIAFAQALVNLTDENSQIENLKNQVSNLTDAINLNKTSIWYNGTFTMPPGSPDEQHFHHFELSNSGYILIEANSTNSNAYFRVLWNCSAGSVYYDQRAILGHGISATFPVLASPSSSTEGWILIGNPSEDSATITFTITYHY